MYCGMGRCIFLWLNSCYACAAVGKLARLRGNFPQFAELSFWVSLLEPDCFSASSNDVGRGGAYVTLIGPSISSPFSHAP